MIHLLLAVIYLSFISLGLPDGLLGAAWPTMYGQLNVPVSYAGVVSMIIALGTIVSSLQSDRLTRKLGTGRVTALSVALTAVSLFGFSCCSSFWMLCLWAVPYGLGAGSVDASINNYVALHYASRHMSWLHCMWGLGASIGPYVMGHALTGGYGWPAGYRWVGVLQLLLTAILLFSLPLWKKRGGGEGGDGTYARALTLREIIAIPGAREVMLLFFGYCALEQTAALWASSYFTLFKGVAPEAAAGHAGLFFLGITFGRGGSGFLALKLNDPQMIRLGLAVITLGVAALFLPGHYTAVVGFLIIGFGCAPVYPCIIHSTPDHFGVDRSQAIIGVQMASAYVGTCLMPPFFGLIARALHIALLPVLLALILALMAVMHERLLLKTEK